jgi:iron complex transport system substrate-binding protein
MKNYLTKISRFHIHSQHFLWLLLLPAILLISCRNQTAESNSTQFELSDNSPVLAEGFRITDAGRYSILEFVNPSRPDHVLQRFYLVDRHNKLPESVPDDGTLLKVPVESMVCLEATQLSFADALDLMDKITGVASADYVVSAAFKHLIDDGKIKEIGISDHFKLEQLLDLAPEVVLATLQQGQSYEPLRNAGLTVVSLAGHLENHPLGRAEWIKLFGVLFKKETKAQIIFDSISHQYNTLKTLTANVSKRPVVLSGKQYGGFWNLPGGKSYLAQMLYDAGASYLWAENDESGSLMLDFETVYHRGIDADYWRFLVYSDIPFTYAQLLGEDARYAGLKAFKEKNVLICNTFEKPYFQKGVLEPQVLLADYIAVFHPELLPGHQPVYYELLK